MTATSGVSASAAMIESMPLAPRNRALVGRDRELDRLRRVSGAADPVVSAAVLVSGDAGIGKSRLVAELAATAGDAGRLVVAGHCVGVGGQGLAWLPFVELVGELARTTSALEQTIEKYPALAALRPGGDGEVDTNPGGMAEAVHALLSAAATEQPLLVVVEDVHWADHSSRDLLTVLLTRGFRAPVSLVVTYRSDDLHRQHPLHDVLAVWTRLPLLTRMDLGPLGAEHMHRLVRDLDHAPTSTSEVTDIVEMAGGNPFFAEELVAGGDRSFAGHDLSRLLRLRLDQLDDSARLLVRAASLAGRTVDPDRLGEVTGLDAEALDDAFHQAIDHQILEPTGAGGFRFRHPLIGETVAQELLPGARRRLHESWLAVLQAHPATSGPADLARHAAATGDLDTAAEAAVEAGDAAMRVGGARDALRLYEAALGWAAHDPGRRAEAALCAAKAAKAAGDQVRSLDLLEEALVELDDSADPRLRAELLGRAAVWYATLDLPGDALTMSTEAVSLLPEWREPADFAVLMRHLDVLVNLGRAADGTALIDEIVARAEELDLPEVVAETRLHEARLLSGVDPERGRVGLEATALDPAAPGPLRLPALLRLGTLARNGGDVRAAWEYYSTGVEVAAQRRRPWGPYGMECRIQAGRAAYELGRWPEAEAMLTSPVDLPHPPRGFMEGALVELEVARGDDVDPDRLAETVHWWEVDVLLVVGTLGGLIDLLGRTGRHEELVDLVGRGIATMERLWGREAQAIIRLAALFTGQVADLAAARGVGSGASPAVVSAASEASDAYAARVEEIADRDDLRIGPESRAWIDRHTAERLRLAAARGERPEPDALVGAWRRAAAGFAALPNRPEEARSLARLAEALTLVGRTAEAAEAAARARAIADELGARPVLELVEGIAPSPAAPSRSTSGGTTDGEPTALTPRELEILEHVSLGRTNGEIASRLFISRKTVSVHVSNILAKLGASTRGEASAVARDRGLLT